MSSGKVICAYGISLLYDAKPEVFLQNLSIALGYNIKARLYDSTSSNNDEKLIIENGFEDFLEINLDRDREFSESYFVEIPIAHQEKELWFEFYPSGIVDVNHIPFSSTWKFFIEEILDKTGSYFGGWDKYVERMRAVRELYISLFKKIGCKEVLLSKNANHIWEDQLVFSTELDKKPTFQDILDVAKKEDDMMVYHLQNVLTGEFHDEIEMLYKANEYLKIAFRDNIID